MTSYNVKLGDSITLDVPGFNTEFLTYNVINNDGYTELTPSLTWTHLDVAFNPTGGFGNISWYWIDGFDSTPQLSNGVLWLYPGAYLFDISGLVFIEGTGKPATNVWFRLVNCTDNYTAGPYPSRNLARAPVTGSVDQTNSFLMRHHDLIVSISDKNAYRLEYITMGYDSMDPASYYLGTKHGGLDPITSNTGYIPDETGPIIEQLNIRVIRIGDGDISRYI